MRDISRDPISDGPRNRGRMPDRRGGGGGGGGGGSGGGGSGGSGGGSHRREETMRNISSQNWRDKSDAIQNSPRDLPRRDEK